MNTLEAETTDHTLHDELGYMLIPGEAQKFIGEWIQVSTDGYELFLKEVMRLSWVTRKIALHVKPKSTWYIEDDKLCCKVQISGFRTVIEKYGFESVEFDENDEYIDGVIWHMKVYWDSHGILCTDKTCPMYNGGRSISIRRWVDESVLYVSYEWAPGKVFMQKCARCT